MKRRTLLNLSGALFAAIALSAASSLAWADGPAIVGTWELNVAKSTSTARLPKSQTRTYEATAQQEKMTGTGVDAKGNTINTAFTAELDGKDYPFMGPNADTIALTPVDAFKSNFVLKSAGKVVLSGTRVISADGKMYTLSSKGTNAAGEAVETSLVFDKR